MRSQPSCAPSADANFRIVTVSYPVRHSGAPWRIKDAPPDRRTHACAERGGEPGIHIPAARVHGFRASSYGRSRNDIRRNMRSAGGGGAAVDKGEAAQHIDRLAQLLVTGRADIARGD